MRRLAKRLLLGTRWELPARRLVARLTGDLNRQYDAQSLQVMRRVLRRDSNCIDVGCHEGLILRQMLRHAPDGRHFAFEPIPAMCQRLRQDFADRSNVQVHELALGNAAGTSTFQHVVSNPGFSGLRRRQYGRADEQIEELTVRTARLDDVIPAEVTVDFMKVDVEGAELLVFQGGVETLRRCQPVLVFEHGLGAADHYDARPEAMFDLLAGTCGLRLFLMRDWLRDPQSPLSREAFCTEFHEARNYYFMAHR